VAWLAPAGRAAGAVLRDPVIVILLLAGPADLLAGDPLVDGVVLLTVAAALGWDRVRQRAPEGPVAARAGRRWRRRGLAGGYGRSRTLMARRSSMAR
jgi:hypothetical protein